MAQSTPRTLYFVPGVHYSTPARTSFSMTAFIDGRGGVIGKGHIVTLEGGRDAMKASIGIADVSAPTVGYSVLLSGLQTRSKPLDATPNASYAGTEFHLFVKVVNLGVGFYAPVGDHKGRRGHLALSAGVGF